MGRPAAACAHLSPAGHSEPRALCGLEGGCSGKWEGVASVQHGLALKSCLLARTMFLPQALGFEWVIIMRN